jgi:DHA1 family bicyclomycin/chloramphenicol resistance-like MFS transporter
VFAAQARRVVVLGSLIAIGSLSVDMYLPALPALTRDFGASASGVQLTLTSCLAGLALGQLLTGSASDRFGRRRPLLVGLAVFSAASVACALAPSILAMVLLRFVQGFAGAAGIVVARAVVRDLYAGDAASRFFSLLMLVTGVAPIVGPVLGGSILTFTTWRGIFIAIAGAGVLLLALTAIGLEETLPARRRGLDGLRGMGRAIGHLNTDPVFAGYALAAALTMAAVFAYVAGSPFVLQNVYGASPQLYGAVFALNAVGLVAAAQFNAWLVGRVSSRALLLAGLAGTGAAGLLLVAGVAIGDLGPWSVVVPLFVLMTSFGLVNPNAMALAMAGHPELAGSASAVLGFSQFAFGAVVAPFVGIAGEDTAAPMALAIALPCAGALIAVLTLTRRPVSAPPAEAAREPAPLPPLVPAPREAG